MKKIAIYGLSKETEYAINSISEYEIVGLLDGYRTDGILYGKQIIPIEVAIERGIEFIIVVARPGSCKAIIRRIEEICRNNNIKVYDIRGNNLLNNVKEMYSKRDIIGRLNTLIEKINFADNLKVELFITHFNKIQEKINKKNAVVYNAYDIGYLFFAPIITDFVIWFKKKVASEFEPNILFCARDGYLVKKMYDNLENNNGSKYFLTSRIVAIRAGIENEEDLEYIENMKFSGSVKESVISRFGIDLDSIDDNTVEEQEIFYYKNNILEKAKKVKTGYKKYIDSLDIKKRNVMLFDFVAKGTTQYFIQRLLKNKITGYYFLKLDSDFYDDKKLDILSFYSTNEGKQSIIYDDYYILETILTSPEPSVVEFTTDGNPVYAKETRTEQDLKCLKEIQQGIIDYFEEYILKCPVEERKMNKKLDELFLGFVHNVEIKNEAFLNFVVEDTFFNRMTDIKDVL